MMKRYSIMLLGLLVISTCLKAQRYQDTDNKYSMSLDTVLKMVEARYHVTVKYHPEQVAGLTVPYAVWRFRDSADETLANVLAPLDMKVNREGPTKFKLKDYEYFRWPVADGWKELDRIAAQYHDAASFELRKDSLRLELYQALQLSPLPAKPDSKPILTALRKYDGYSVQNIAIEILPGLYINGSIYRPLNVKGKIPVMLSPDGHWAHQRYRPDCQIRCATLARMGVMAFSYDLFAWGESLLQFKPEDHQRSLSQTIQTLDAIRILDYVCGLKEVDTNRIGISGGSGGGSHTVLMAALDPRIKLSAPVVSVSSYFYGGCPCESGMPIFQCGGGTDYVELAAMAAPHPQLLVSDGSDWTAQMPEHDFPYLQKIYGYYNKKSNVENVHLPNENHDYGISKRLALYHFVAKYWQLDLKKIEANGKIDESQVTIEKEPQMYVFGDHGQYLPKDAVMGFDNLVKVFTAAVDRAKLNQFK